MTASPLQRSINKPRFAFSWAILILVSIPVPLRADIKLLSNAPDYAWWYGCTPTSAGMLMAYYDINGYQGQNYDNLIPGGTAELSTFAGNPYGDPTGWSALANNAIASSGHVSDFYVSGYGASGDDVSPPFHSFDSLADFMGTSQDSVSNSNGSTWLYNWSDGHPFTPLDAEVNLVTNESGMYGIYEYVSYRGYNGRNVYNQLIYNASTAPNGCTFADFKAEIDAGRPSLVHVEGHTMFAYGYDDTPGSERVYLRDTWTEGGENDGGTMAWGGSYYYPTEDRYLDHVGFTFFTPSPVPEAGSLALFGVGAALLLFLGRRRNAKKG